MAWYPRMTQVSEPILVRPPHESDQAYVASTWMNSLVGTRDWPRDDARKLVDSVLDRSDTRLRLASPQRDPGTILGWIAYVEKPAVLHYVYVRSKQRSQGVGRMLVQAAGLLEPPALVYTLRGPSWRTLIEKHPNLVHVGIKEFVL